MSEVWSLPGYEVRALLGAGGTGEVWRARCLATGDVVAVKRLRPGLDPGQVRREAELLAALDTPYVVRPREVVDVAGGTVLVLDHVDGGSLATLLARRAGALGAGEVVTVGRPLAQALAAVHAVGLSHGGVTPADVLLTSEGMPQLSDVGLRRLAGESAGGAVEPGPAADVRSLAALCHHLLAGAPPDDRGAGVLVAAGGRAPLAALAPAAPAALVAAVEAALAPDPADLPDAAAFADLLRRACAAVPLQPAGAAGRGGEAPRGTRTSRSRALPGRWVLGASGPPLRRPARQHVVVGGGIVVLVVVAGTAGWLSGRSAAGPTALPPLPPVPAAAGGPSTAGGLVRPAAPGPGPATAPAPATAPVPVPDAAPDWASVLDRLDGARAQAFADGDAAALSEVYAAGSPGLAADTALVEALAVRQQAADGVRHSVRSVEVLASAADSARLRVVDVLAGYAVRDATGRVVSRAGGRGPSPFVAELVRVEGQWRLVQVRPER